MEDLSLSGLLVWRKKNNIVGRFTSANNRMVPFGIVTMRLYQTAPYYPVMRNRKRERYMETNLTRYTCFLRDDGHSIAALMVPSDTGEYVKFADVKESLSTSHNKPSTKSCAMCANDCSVKCMLCVRESEGRVDMYEPRKTSCVG
jgi:hypothetical protein